MKYVPLNRHYVIKPYKSEEATKEEASLLIPKKYKENKKNMYSIWRIVESPCETTSHIGINKIIVVEDNMVKKIDSSEFGGTHPIFLIQENYILFYVK